MACGERKHHGKKAKNLKKFHRVWIDEDQEWNYYLKIQNGSCATQNTRCEDL